MIIDPDVNQEDKIKSKAGDLAWKELVREFTKPSLPRAIWQVVNTIVPYGLLWYFMYLSMSVSYWITVPLAILAGAFLVRIFIIFHDCGHGSFFKSKRANEIVGFVAGLLTFTPYHHWRWEHAIHHGTSGDLDQRGTGDVWTMTVQEYLESGRLKRFAYRLSRNPFVLFVFAPLFMFLIWQRFTKSKAPRREKNSVHLMNISLLAMGIALSQVFGLEAYLIIQLTVMMVAGTAGVWMFYVQHQFEGTYWERGDDWDYTQAALKGSSFYKLPKILQWFSGNIGFHHIHHLSARIPNYNLERCHDADPLFQSVKPVTLLSSFKSMTFRFWDEQGRQLVGYSYLRELRKREKELATAGE